MIALLACSPLRVLVYELALFTFALLCSALPLGTGPFEIGVFRYFPWLGEEPNRMKASKLTEAQKAFILKQGEEGTPVAEICRS